MTKRATKEVHWSRARYVLKNTATAVDGEVACIDTSGGYEVCPAGTSTTLIGIGYFEVRDTVDGTLLGDGTKKVSVRLFEPLVLHVLDNDATNPVLTSDIGSECYLVDKATVSISSGGSTRSKAGRVWDVTDDGVLVEGGSAVTGPTGATGSGPGTSATRTTLKAVAAASRYDGQLVMVLSDGSLWRFVAASAVATDVAEELVLVPAAGTGRWIRADKAFTLKAAIAFGMADGALILTVPAGYVLRPTGLPYWDVTTPWTGGAASTIGIASDVAGYNTAGDLLGGAAGDATAVLGTTGVKAGTIGPKLDTPAEVQAFFLEGGKSLTYEEITSAYTAGAGFACFPVSFAPIG